MEEKKDRRYKAVYTREGGGIISFHEGGGGGNIAKIMIRLLERKGEIPMRGSTPS